MLLDLINIQQGKILIFITKIRLKVCRFHLPIPSQFLTILKKELLIIEAWGKHIQCISSFLNRINMDTSFFKQGCLEQKFSIHINIFDCLRHISTDHLHTFERLSQTQAQDVLKQDVLPILILLHIYSPKTGNLQVFGLSLIHTQFHL